VALVPLAEFAFSPAWTPGFGTISADGTGTPHQSHLFYATGDAAWWLVWIDATSPTSLRTARSTDLITWTGQASLVLSHSPKAGTTVEYGNNIGVAYKSISSTDVVHITIGWRTSATAYGLDHVRATIAAGSITFGSVGTLESSSTSNPVDQAYCPALNIDSNNRPEVVSVMGGASSTGDFNAHRATNTDAGSSWTAGWDANVDVSAGASDTDVASVLDLGGGVSLGLIDAGDVGGKLTKNIKWAKTSATGVWSAVTQTALAAATTANFDSRDWGAVARTTTDVFLVVRNPDSATNYLCRRFNGTSWSNGPAIPAQACKAGAGVFLTTDGTDVWLFVIDSDAANTIRYVKYSNGAGTWGTWTAFETSTQTRTALSGYRLKGADGNLGVAWTEDAGSGTFRVVSKPLSIALLKFGVASAEQRSTVVVADTKVGAGSARSEQRLTVVVGDTKVGAATARAEQHGLTQASGTKIGANAARAEQRNLTQEAGVLVTPHGAARPEQRSLTQASGTKLSAGSAKVEQRNTVVVSSLKVIGQLASIAQRSQIASSKTKIGLSALGPSQRTEVRTSDTKVGLTALGPQQRQATATSDTKLSAGTARAEQRNDLRAVGGAVLAIPSGTGRPQQRSQVIASGTKVSVSTSGPTQRSASRAVYGLRLAIGVGRVEQRTTVRPASQYRLSAGAGSVSQRTQVLATTAKVGRGTGATTQRTSTVTTTAKVGHGTGIVQQRVQTRPMPTVGFGSIIYGIALRADYAETAVYESSFLALISERELLAVTSLVGV
jgi:hypothetical protein